MAKVMKKVESPVIAFDEMSILDTLAMSERQDAQNTQNVISAKIRSGLATQEDFDKLDELRSPETVRTRVMEQCADMAKFVRRVPSDWFVKGMDGEPDFSDPQTYTKLQPKRFFELYQMLMMGGVQQDNVSGN